MPGMLGPRMSASMSPIQPPICWSATARFTLTVDLPTPPLPLPTAMTWRIPGSFSGPADAWDDAPGACWLPSCGSVVCIPQFPAHRARWPLLNLDLDVGSRHANAISHSGSLGRRTYDFARPNVECGAVPGTGHFVPRHLSIGERPAAVSAGVVEREELAVDVEQGNLLALHLDQTRLTRPDLSCPRCLHKVSHRSFPSITFLSFIQPTHAGTRSNVGPNWPKPTKSITGNQISITGKLCQITGKKIFKSAKSGNRADSRSGLRHAGIPRPSSP